MGIGYQLELFLKLTCLTAAQAPISDRLLQLQLFELRAVGYDRGGGTGNERGSNENRKGATICERAPNKQTESSFES